MNDDNNYALLSSLSDIKLVILALANFMEAKEFDNKELIEELKRRSSKDHRENEIVESEKATKIKEAVRLLDQTKGAFKSKLVMQAREILESIVSSHQKI